MATDEIVIHARYTADGSVNEISERPESLTGQQWFNLLCVKVPHAIHALAGGRVVFRVSPSELESLKASAAA